MAIKYDITLSTTEPNNEVGLLKIRQADEQTQTLVTQITENGLPKSYEGLQVFFCAKLGQTAGLGIIEQKLNANEMTNPAAGKLEYTLRDEDWQQLGRQTAYFSFRKMKNAHEWTEQFSTRDFTYNITKNVFSEGVKEVKKDGSTYVWTIEDLIRIFEEYIASGKTDWEEFVDQNKEILESVDPGGKILAALGLMTDFRRQDADLISKMKNEFYERGYNVKTFGAKGDGLTDDTAALKIVENLVNETGGTVIFPVGKYLIKEPLVFTHAGTQLQGIAAYWDDKALDFGSVLMASEEFVGDSIVRFEATGDEVIRSVGISKLTIDGGANSNAHGLTIDTGYDFCLFENVMVQGIDGSKHAWNVIAKNGKVSQTHTYINCIGKHRDNTATTSTCYFERLQEAVMINFKSWGGHSTTFASNGIPFELKECTGITFYNPSAVGTTETGFLFDVGKVGKGSNIQLINPLFEQVKQPVKFVTNAIRLYGSITSPPNVGTTIGQNGNTATVSFASGSGVYVYDTTGEFTTGGIFNESGDVIGIINQVDKQNNEFIKIQNPKTMGGNAAPFKWALENIKNCEIEIDNKISPASTINVTSSAVQSKLKLAMPQELTIARDDLKIEVLGYKRTIVSNEISSGVIYLEKAVPGMEVMIVNNRSSKVPISPAVGETIEGYASIEIASGTRLVAKCVSLGTWILSDIKGSVIRLDSNGARQSLFSTNDWSELFFTASQQIGFEHVKRIITNKNANGYVAFNLSKTDTVPRAEFRFVKDANGVMEVIPNGADRFRGKNYGEKITIANVGDSLHILNSAAGIWDII